MIKEAICIVVVDVDIIVNLIARNCVDKLGELITSEYSFYGPFPTDNNYNWCFNVSFLLVFNTVFTLISTIFFLVVDQFGGFFLSSFIPLTHNAWLSLLEFSFLFLTNADNFNQKVIRL